MTSAVTSLLANCSSVRRVMMNFVNIEFSVV